MECRRELLIGRELIPTASWGILKGRPLLQDVNLHVAIIIIFYQVTLSELSYPKSLFGAWHWESDQGPIRPERPCAVAVEGGGLLFFLFLFFFVMLFLQLLALQLVYCDDVFLCILI